MPIYFSVVRKGVNDKPREMRFGKVLWSKKDDKYRERIVLFDKAVDEGGLQRGWLEPEATNVAASLAATRLRLSALLDKLVAKGVLTTEESEQVRTVDDDRFERELRERYRVNDVDEWMGDED